MILANQEVILIDCSEGDAMFHNYHYFIVLAEECNISRAAERLFITHQNLSKYLSNLEHNLGVVLFQRKPTISLTYAGRLMLQTLQKTQEMERNLRAQFIDLRQDVTGEIRIGTTEGRFRILMPDIMSEFKNTFPDVHLRISSAPSPELRKSVQSHQLDLMIAAIPQENVGTLEHITVLNERLYLVISDNMLRDIFGDQSPACKEQLRNGADLRLFRNIPFAMNLPHFNSSRLIQKHLGKLGIELLCVHTSSHPDLHHIMSARDFAASFCLTMYVPMLLKINETTDNKLNIFPILGLSDRNPLAVFYSKNDILPHYTRSLIQMIKKQCNSFSQYDRLITATTNPGET